MVITDIPPQSPSHMPGQQLVIHVGIFIYFKKYLFVVLFITKYQQVL